MSKKYIIIIIIVIFTLALYVNIIKTNFFNNLNKGSVDEEKIMYEILYLDKKTFK